MKDFFIDKFEYDFRSNQKWVEVLQKNEDQLSDFVRKSMSHVINVHHIWISRILDKKAESHTWDVLPIDFWDQLMHDNLCQTIEYLEHVDHSEKVDYHSEEGVKLSKSSVDILYHILNHSNYHRAQIAMELRKLDITPPSFNFIAYH
ncbi:MAG: DinB family protein [Crocinitomicaceae bacterium]|nr:DinB family protein [Crocinitomicaceae bacterium]